MTDAQTLIDLSYLELMADGDDFMKKTMLDMLIEEMPPEIEKLRGAYLSQDFVALKDVAHKMKSTLSFVGNDAMTEANATLELIGKEATDMPRAAQHLEVMEERFTLVFPALQAESAKLD